MPEWKNIYAEFETKIGVNGFYSMRTNPKHQNKKHSCYSKLVKADRSPQERRILPTL